MKSCVREGKWVSVRSRRLEDLPNQPGVWQVVRMTRGAIEDDKWRSGSKGVNKNRRKK